MQQSSGIRSFGEATGFVESAVMDHAIMLAQERMAVLLRSAIEVATQNYTRNSNMNLDSSSATLLESVSKRFSVAESKDSKMLKRSVYDLSNGQIQIYVCIESNQSWSQIGGELANELSKEKILGLQFDRDRFAASMKQGLDEYKQKLDQQASVSAQ